MIVIIVQNISNLHQSSIIKEELHINIKRELLRNVRCLLSYSLKMCLLQINLLTKLNTANPLIQLRVVFS